MPGLLRRFDGLILIDEGSTSRGIRTEARGRQLDVLLFRVRIGPIGDRRSSLRYSVFDQDPCNKALGIRR